MTTYETRDLDLAAYLAATVDFPSEILLDRLDNQAVFEFDLTASLHSAVVEFATGPAMIPARRLLAARRRLFHEVRRVRVGVQNDM